MVHFIVPARLGSSRLPRKVLADLGGQPMIRRVVECIQRVRGARVVVATDADEVVAALVGSGAQVVRTPACASGTDRVAWTARELGLTGIVVNVQGDEPLIEATDLERLVEGLRAGGGPMATLCARLSTWEQLIDPACVKVVPDQRGDALYFSRAPVPFPRDWPVGTGPLPASVHAWGHVGVYAFQSQALQAFAALPVHELEQQEGLEQLRALAAGWPIHLVEAHTLHRSVDTPADLAAVRALREPPWRA